MKFDAVRIHLLCDVFGLFSSKNFATMTTWLNVSIEQANWSRQKKVGFAVLTEPHQQCNSLATRLLNWRNLVETTPWQVVATLSRCKIVVVRVLFCLRTAPFFRVVYSLTLVPRSLLRNRTESLATQDRHCSVSFQSFGFRHSLISHPSALLRNYRRNS